MGRKCLLAREKSISSAETVASTKLWVPLPSRSTDVNSTQPAERAL